ncbi:LysR family transcriptional regulator [Allopusillimonas soli]|uniref:LysR family transcriptional regulator n=1 Tax=Allopusillimonas soli TaxID=659016 RepID=A0A853FCL4_9BURK|nr:LysR family transcriptional regulator [Allopusillimonas soli]NYT37402.1 LysR family transcriptional regulator [Allopusillimonas soli]TEA74616.1 LysR family transcriptional regulator [Allopusillimonas soli]
MKQLWIEDFLTLAETGSFSGAAALRHVTQPAFSRRIQQLETWLGVELVDRRSQPMHLTAVAQRYVPAFQALLRDMHQLRNRMQAEHNGSARIVLATQHSLTMARLPPLLELFMACSPPRIDVNVRSEDHDECVAVFLRGEADLLLCMEEQHDPLYTLIPDSLRLPMGYETLVPLSAPGMHGGALHQPQADKPLNLLAFPSDSFLGRIMYKQAFPALMQYHNVEIVHESVFLAGVKEMLLAGFGMAWLPQSLVERELKAGALVILTNGDDDVFQPVRLQLGLYRNAHSAYPEALDRIWSQIKTQR